MSSRWLAVSGYAGGLLLACIIWLISLPSLHNEAIFYSLSDSANTSTVTLPLNSTNREYGQSFVIDATLDYKPYQSGLLRFISESCIVAIRINDGEQDILPDHSNISCLVEATTLDISEHLVNGANSIKVTMASQNNIYGFNIKPMFSTARVVLMIACVFLYPALCALARAWRNKERIQHTLWDYRWHILILGVGMIISIFMRMALMDVPASDYRVFLTRWMEYVRRNELESLYAKSFNNYTPLYGYMLGIFDRLFPELQKIYSVKSLSMVGDLFGAYWIYRLVGLAYRDKVRPLAPVLAVAFTLCLPSAIINSSGIGQCDMWWVSFLLAALYYLIRERPVACLIYTGLAFSFKFQSIFLAPLLLICLIKRLIPMRHLWIITAIYLATCLPAWIEGRNLSHMLLIYWQQFHTYAKITETGNLYYPFYVYGYDYLTVRNIGLMLAVGVVCTIVVFTCQGWQHRTLISYVLLATLFATIVPYLLPKMINRYFLAADMLALALACMRPRWWGIAALIQVASVLTFQGWQFAPIKRWTQLPDTARFPVSVVLYAAALAILLFLCQRYVWKPSPHAAAMPARNAA